MACSALASLPSSCPLKDNCLCSHRAWTVLQLSPGAPGLADAVWGVCFFWQPSLRYFHRLPQGLAPRPLQYCLRVLRHHPQACSYPQRLWRLRSSPLPRHSLLHSSLRRHSQPRTFFHPVARPIPQYLAWTMEGASWTDGLQVYERWKGEPSQRGCEADQI